MLAEGCTSHDGLLNFKSGMASNEKTVGWNERKKKCKRNSKLCTVNVVNNKIQFGRFVVSKYLFVKPSDEQFTDLNSFDQEESSILETWNDFYVLTRK